MRAQLEIDLNNSAQEQLKEQKEKLKGSFETALKKIREDAEAEEAMAAFNKAQT